jgi:putative salt-induced outer membrane protein
MNAPLVFGSLLLASLAVAAQAEWKGKGEVGIVFARGNSETETGNIKLDMATELERWKHGFGIAALRSSSENVLTAERYSANWQSDFKINDRSFWFGGLRYEQDEFSGFDYQASATTGYGYKFIDSDSVKLAGQLAYEHQLTPTTELIDKLVVESGSDNTFASNDLSLQVSMTERLALSFGVGVRFNSDPPAGLKSTDTLTTVNLVVAL